MSIDEASDLGGQSRQEMFKRDQIGTESKRQRPVKTGLCSIKPDREPSAVGGAHGIAAASLPRRFSPSPP